MDEYGGTELESESRSIPISIFGSNCGGTSYHYPSKSAWLLSSSCTMMCGEREGSNSGFREDESSALIETGVWT